MVALAAALGLASAASADTTIGANVNLSTVNKGTCGWESPSERPCTFVNTVIAGQVTAAPCDGTVTRFRLNGFVKPANHYRLRVIRKNADGTFTGTASSASVSIASEGVNEYATSLPISTGELLGIDFEDSTEEFGLRWVGGTAFTVEAFYNYAFPADGTAGKTPGGTTFYYLFNADVACGSSSPPPTPPPVTKPPSNEFTILKLKKTTVSLNLASAGSVAVADASAKAKASVSASKAKPKLLKPSSASGGPGEVKVPLKLTGAAKKTLNAKGKVKVKAQITFTPTGGAAAVQTRSFTVKKPKPAK